MPVNLKALQKVYCRLFFDLSDCLLCGQPGRALCAPCTALISALPANPCRCGLPQITPVTTVDSPDPPLCGRCIRRPPPFSAARSAVLYGFPVDRLITRYKSRGDLTAERACQQLLQRQVLPWPDADALCPLPAHWRRRWLRGFDQSARLTARLAKQWQRPLLPALQRQRPTPHQQGLRASQRRHNLRRAFRCVQPVTGLHLVLVDDVMTTGSSARAAARCLLDAGARRVSVWTLARTPAGR